MKNLILLLISLQCLNSSCKKPNQDYSGEAHVLMNKSRYINRLVAYTVKGKLTFGLRQYEKVGGMQVERRSLSFAILDFSEAKQILVRDSLLPRSLFTTSQDDGDVGGDFFVLDSTAGIANYFKINKQENNYKEIWGEFNVKLIRITNCSCTDLPDNVNFTNGTFHIVLKD